MIVKGTHTKVENVEIDLNDAGIKSVVYGQSIEYLADAIREKLFRKFLHGLAPDFVGKRVIRKSYRSGSEGKLVLVHVDADWDYHKNVGHDEEVRVLTEEEEERYKVLCGISEAIKDLEK